MKVNNIFQSYVSLGWLKWLLHSTIDSSCWFKYPSYLPASFSYKHFNKPILLFSNYVKVLTEGIKLASMVWMFDKQNIKIRNTDSRIKQHLMQKKLSKNCLAKIYKSGLAKKI